ncbi:MAG: TldD/PmbA family protein, partial [Thermoplasmata archaeon]|nr:TldD/PmbA family protein [Thermoplasmata archaeon]
LLGQVVGPECLTLVDDGSYPTGWGSIFFDDEGHPSQRTVLVDHGRFVEVLHDRESAAVFHRPATGNTRRADFLSRPFVRMTNTFVEPGGLSLEELATEAKNGVLLETCTSGIEDPLGGNMQIKVKKGHRIVNGEIGEILPSMALSGRVLEFLQAIRGVGLEKDFSMSPGFCGKGHTDLLPAGTGGTYLLSEAVVGPA